jgi:hypothetical protein
VGTSAVTITPDQAPVTITPDVEQAPPGMLDRANELASKALSGAGLPTSLSNVPDWFRHLTGTHPDSEPFWEPIRKAIKNPTQENIVGAVPFIGPSSVAMSKDVRAGDYGGAAATLAGTVGAAALPVKAPEVAAGLSDATTAAKNAPGALRDAASTTLRDEMGKIRPGVRTAAKAAGAGTGALVGGGWGALVGEHLGEGLAEAAIPAREPVVAKATPLTQSPNYPKLQAARRQAMQEARQAQQSTQPGSTPQSVNTTSQSQILSPESSSAPIESEGRPATWTNQTVLQRASQGDMVAIQQARLRALPMPENANFVGNKAATVTPQVGTPRSITTFDAEGNPIPPTPPQLKGGPASFNRLSLSDGEDLGPGMGTDHIIRDRAGNRVGSIQIERTGDNSVHVHWLGGEFGNARGPLMDAIKDQYPGTERITYDRRRLAAGAKAATTTPREMPLQ